MSTSCRVIAVIALGAASACSSSAQDEMLPSVLSGRSFGSRAGELASGNLYPCGFEYTEDNVQSAGRNSIHNRARITYNTARLDVREDGVDDDNEFAFRRTFDYDAMGNLVHNLEVRPNDVVSGQTWRVYDSFGRELRRSEDLDGDGRVDAVTAYDYARDGNPNEAHLVSAAASSVVQRYQYDESGRLIQVERDLGADGSTDQTLRYEYDDLRRMITMTGTDAAGAVFTSQSSSFDAQNHVRYSVVISFDGKGNQTGKATSLYNYESGRLTWDTYINDTSSDSSVSYVASRYDWQYDHCK